MTYSLGVPTTRVPLPEPKVHHIAGWGAMLDPKRVEVLRRISESAGRDPRMRRLAADILTAAGVQARDYEGQASALLSWVQRNIRYLNEPGEIIQDPQYTLTHRLGDCDDMAVLLGSLYESIALPYRYVLAGRKQGKAVRWVEGSTFPSGVQWAHIYLRVGTPPFNPEVWYWAEPTMLVPLGTDVTQGPRTGLPELGYGAALSTGASAGGAATAANLSAGGLFGISWGEIVTAAVTGVAVSVLSQILLDELHPFLEGWREERKRARARH